MSAGLTRFPEPIPGPEEPLEMLQACHRRIERQCATLMRLVPHLAARGADPQARTAARNAMRYFDTSAGHHHADEEEDLLPALLESASGPEATRLRELIERLTEDHRALELAWRRLRPVLEAVTSGEPAPLTLEAVEALAGIYERHIELEERELLPMAARLLRPEDVARIGAAMRRRRIEPAQPRPGATLRTSHGPGATRGNAQGHTLDGRPFRRAR